MFNFLRKNNEYYSCEWLEGGAHFSYSGLYHCDKYAHKGSNIYPVSYLTKKRTYNFLEFSIKKYILKFLLKNGKTLTRCNGCSLLTKKDWKKSNNQFTNIAISSNTTCNSNCIYCESHKLKRAYNLRPDVPVYDILKKLFLKQKIHPDCEFQFGGGEPVLNKEFDKIIDLLIENNIHNIKIYSSAIKYSNSIEKLFKKNQINQLVISPDSGNKELYLKIKNVDEHESVWQNIKKYSLLQIEKKDIVRIKYIIISNINDKENYFKEFLEKLVETKVKLSCIDVDMESYKKNSIDENFVHKMIKLIVFFERNCKKYDLECIYFPTVSYIINQNIDLYNKIKKESL